MPQIASHPPLPQLRPLVSSPKVAYTPHQPYQHQQHPRQNELRSRIRAVSTGSTNIIESLMTAAAMVTAAQQSSVVYDRSTSSSSSPPPPPTPQPSVPCLSLLTESPGCMFEKRDDWSILSRLPVSKQNSIHVRVEDDGPFGNDETRLHLLSHFSSLRITHVSCILCSCVLTVYDRFPLVDGMFLPNHINS